MAYPLMHQISLAIASYNRSKSRAMDVRELKTHSVKILNSMASSIFSDIPDMKIPDVSFIFGGYSWIHKCFDIWIIRYRIKDQQFIARPINYWVGGMNPMIFGGDMAKEANKNLVGLMRKKGQLVDNKATNKTFDMEPFEVVRDMLRNSSRRDSIGGAPQVVKVYQHMNALPLGVYWPSKAEGKVYIQGRPLLGYENTDFWVLDPDTFYSENINHKVTIN
ncbi:hypothetical protein ANRL3_02768 [Anaerolineae bacterium]|nr:hypothetical protein ANRL3_02768 [Anaerolineae bacterium]